MWYDNVTENKERNFKKMLKNNEITKIIPCADDKTVRPDIKAYEMAMRSSAVSNIDWKPDSKYSFRKMVTRRKAEDKLYLEGAFIVNIDIHSIFPNRLQPRVNFESNATIRLADSIRRYGILQPITVRTVYDEKNKDIGETTLSDVKQKDLKFEIVAGERRFRAAKMLGMTSIPCIIIGADDKKSAELALIENLLREDLNIFETSRAIKKLIDNFKLTQEEVAKRLSMSQSGVANKLRLLKYTPEEEKLILENHLTERHARALLKLSDPKERISVIHIIIKTHMNVSATENYIEKLLADEEERDTIVVNNRKIPIIKDIRLFYNSLDKALDIVKSAGIEILSNRREDESGVTIEIKIPHPRKAV